ncbi:MAG: TIGR04028 family ABC transporter substrate-binding protein [Arachnia sp.]
MAKHTWVRALTALLVTSVATALLTSCGGDAEPPTTPVGSHSGAAKTGGTLTYLEPQTFNTLYPPSAGFYPNGGIINNITDRLLYQNPETLQLEPWIATALPEINDDATEYTFTLRDDVTYSDGSKLTAENVVKNLDLFGKGDPDRALPVSEAINNYESGEVVDEHTVKFHFSAPAPGFAQAVSTINSGLVSDATLDLNADGFGPGNAAKIIGSGPFVIEKEEIGTKLTVKAREDYNWAPPSLAHQGRAYLDQIDYVVAGENSVRTGSLTAGQADIARQIEAPDEAVVKGAGLTVVSKPTNGVTNSLSLRFPHPFLSDIKVRQAIIAGIDREAIIEALFTESYPLATSSLAKGALGYKDQSAAYVYDTAKAAQLLDEAGWALGSDGVRTKDGQRLTLTFNIALPQPRSADVLTIIQDQLRQIGIEVKIISGDQAAQTTASADINQVQIYHSMVARADYDVIKSQFHSANRNTLQNLSSATGKVTDPELDKLLEAVASEPKDADRAAASAAVQDYLTEKAYVLPLFEEPQVYGLQTYVEGFSTESVARPTFYSVQLNK